MKPVLIHIRPLHVPTGTRHDVRCGDGPSAATYGLGGMVWEPAVLQRPVLTTELFSPSLDGRVQAGTGRFSIKLDAIDELDVDPMFLYWNSAPVTIWTVDDLNYEARDLEFSGFISGVRIDLETKTAVVDVRVSTAFIEKPLLTLEFDGGGGFGGDVDLRGRLKPAGFGAKDGIEPVWFDLTDNIGMIDGYGNTSSINALFEGGSSMGPRFADYPSYATLKAAIAGAFVPRGSWATSVADGCIGLAAPPKGVIMANAVFGSNRPGAMMRRWIEHHAGVDVADVDTAAFASLDLQVNKPVSFWTEDQRQVKDLVEAMAASCNASPVVTLQRKITVLRAVLSDPVTTLDRSGSHEPRVISWKIADSDPPWSRLRARTARPGRVLSYSEVQYEAVLVDRGNYNPLETYRQGHIVFQPSDGRRYLYINPSPTSGNAPPNSLYWELLQSADGGIAGNANRVQFSRFEAGVTGWGIIANPSGLNIPSFSATESAKVRLLRTIFTATASGQSVSVGNNVTGYQFNVTGGERLSVQVGVGANAAVASVTARVKWLDAGNVAIGAGNVLGTATGPVAFNSKLAGFVTAPSNAVAGYIEVAASSAGAGSCTLEISEPMATQASPDQVVHPNFTPGPNASNGATRNVNRGPWVAGTAYAVGDFFQYNGSSYTVLVDHVASAGSPPPNPNVELLAQQGPPGTPGLDGVPGPPGPGGVSTYTWIAYADAADGTLNFTTSAPGDRAYIGIAHNKTSATESTNPADYQWTAYKGPTQFGVVGSAGMTISSNKVIKTSASSGWDEGVYSSEAWIGGAQLSFRAGQTHLAFMVGFNTDPTANNSYDTIDYAWYAANDGTAYIYESGAGISGYGPYTANTVFSIHYDGKNVRYFMDGVLKRIVGAASNLRFYLDTAFANSGATAYLLDFSAAGTAGLDGAPGSPGAPGPSGPPGNAAIGFVQDPAPISGSFFGQTWYRPTYKEWYYWNGFGWTRILGQVSALEIITQAYIADASIVTAKIGFAQVDMLRVAGGAITANQVATFGDVYCPAGFTSPVAESGWFAIGDGFYGTGILHFSFDHDSTIMVDGAALYQMFVDVGGGYGLASQTIIGIRTNNGDTYYRVAGLIQTVVSGSAVRVKLQATPGGYVPGAENRPFYCRNLVLTLMGGKR